MKNQNKPNGTAPVLPQAKPDGKIEAVNLLQKIEVHVAKAIKLQWAMVKRLKSIDDSIEILAAQKARELNPDEPDDGKAH